MRLKRRHEEKIIRERKTEVNKASTSIRPKRANGVDANR